MFDNYTTVDLSPNAGERQILVGNPIRELHKQCGVYTRPSVVADILDAVGWTQFARLETSCLLEPAAGDGEFVIEAARRLIASYRRHGIATRFKHLRGRITSFELHPTEAARAQDRIYKMLVEQRIHHRTAVACARSWVTCADFLTIPIEGRRFSHVVGNPPYVRWSKVPKVLKARYERLLPEEAARGDLFLPFLDRSFELLEAGGHCGFICSNRWRYMAFASRFRDKWLRRLDIRSEDAIAADEAFASRVDSYPTILIATKRHEIRPKTKKRRRPQGNTLEELGCTVRVGPALGHTPAFVLQGHDVEVEEELLCEWIESSQVFDGQIRRGSKRVITSHDDDGILRDLTQYPGMRAWLERFRPVLESRSIVRNGGTWYRTIDRVRSVDWREPKILVPELAKTPRVALDSSGAIPSHGIYSIFAPDGDLMDLYRRLSGSGLANALDGLAPKVKGGYIRCYKKFLLEMRV